MIYIIGVSHIYYVSSSFSGANPLIVGEYENLRYDESNKNDWHYVTITYDSSNSVYLWKNRANVKWKLYPTNKKDELRVEESNPFYNSGWTIARVTNAGIYGPHNELYTRMKWFWLFYLLEANYCRNKWLWVT